MGWIDMMGSMDWMDRLGVGAVWVCRGMDIQLGQLMEVD